VRLRGRRVSGEERRRQRGERYDDLDECERPHPYASAFFFFFSAGFFSVGFSKSLPSKLARTLVRQASRSARIFLTTWPCSPARSCVNAGSAKMSYSATFSAVFSPAGCTTRRYFPSIQTPCVAATKSTDASPPAFFPFVQSMKPIGFGRSVIFPSRSGTR